MHLIFGRASRVFRRMTLGTTLALMTLAGTCGETDFSFLTARIQPSYLDSIGVSQLMAAKRTAEAKARLAEEYRFRTQPAYFLIESVRPTPPNSSYNTGAADLALENTFVLDPGWPAVFAGNPIDWTTMSLDYHYRAGVVRMPYITVLADAYWETYDPRYARKVIEILRSFRTTLDPAGPHEAFSGLNTAERLEHWWDAFFKLRTCPDISDDDLIFLVRSIYENALNLENVESNDNIEASVERSMFITSILFPELIRSGVWFDYARSALVSKMGETVLADGFESEMATGYHTNVTINYGQVYRLAALNGIELSPEFGPTIENMMTAMLKLAKPNRQVPNPNDSSGTNYPIAPLPAGAVMFNRPDLKFISGAANTVFAETFLGAFTPEERQSYVDMAPQVPAFTSVAMEESGHYVMRNGWNFTDRYLMVELGKWGGGHSHYDTFNVELYGYGRSTVVDPGMVNYLAPFAAEVRSARGHNGVLHNGIGGTGSLVRDVQFVTRSSYDYFAGTTSFGSGPDWTRNILFVKPNYFLLVDEVRGNATSNKPHNQLWHYVPAATTVDAANNRVLLTYNPFYLLSGNLLLQWPEDLNVTFSQPSGYVSRDYGGLAASDQWNAVATPYLSVDQMGTDSNRLYYPTLLYPYSSYTGAPGTTFQHRDYPNGIIMTIGETPLVQKVVVIPRAGATFNQDGVVFDGKIAVIELVYGIVTGAFVHGGTTLTRNGVVLATAGSGGQFDGYRVTFY